MIGKTNVNGTNDASGVGAVLSIDAPIESTVTISQGSFSKILRDSIEIDTLFSRYFYLVKPNKFGSWTITTTNGTDTASDTVLITTNQQYDVTLSFALFIYNLGDQRPSVTNGWGGNGTYTFNTSYINVPLASGGDNANVRTNTTIDLTDYQTLYFEWDGSINVGTGGTNLTMWVAPNQISNSGVNTPSGATKQNQVGGSTQGTFILGTRQLDISDLSGEYYIGFHAGRGGGSGDGWPQVHLLKAYLKK